MQQENQAEQPDNSSEKAAQQRKQSNHSVDPVKMNQSSKLPLNWRRERDEGLKVAPANGNALPKIKSQVGKVNSQRDQSIQFELNNL